MKNKLNDTVLNKVTGGNQTNVASPETKQGEPNSAKTPLERMEELNRNLGVSPVKSDMGTNAEENALPGEIQRNNTTN